MKRTRLTWLVALPLLAAGPVLAQGDAPGERAPKQEPKKERVRIYDEAADARADIAAAVARAKKENKRVLVQWGANWCGWCHLLTGHLENDKDARRKILYEYEVVHVDVGRFDKNMDLVAQFGAEIRGIPFLTVLDGDGKVVVNQPTEQLEKGKAHDPEKVLAFLTEHQAEYLKAEELLKNALDQAGKRQQRVFLIFGAPW